MRPIIVSATIDLELAFVIPARNRSALTDWQMRWVLPNSIGTPAIVVDFGTAVTFDIVNSSREYVGGVIAPGLASVTDYLYQRTALLPRIKLAEPVSVVGKSTVAAMRIGAVIGYRGLVKEILSALKGERGMEKAVIVATGGYGGLIAKEILRSTT